MSETLLWDVLKRLWPWLVAAAPVERACSHMKRLRPRGTHYAVYTWTVTYAYAYACVDTCDGTFTALFAESYAENPLFVPIITFA